MVVVVVVVESLQGLPLAVYGCYDVCMLCVYLRSMDQQFDSVSCGVVRLNGHRSRKSGNAVVGESEIGLSRQAEVGSRVLGSRIAEVGSRISDLGMDLGRLTRGR